MTQILITIDTEIGELGKYRPDAFEVFIEGKVDGKEVGYKFLIDILDKYSAKGEFFVDIYPYKQIEESKFASLCESIAKRGHNVQLHTHPSMAFDEKRIFMYQYSLKEQIEILELGKKKIKEWTSKYPIAHRAGGYGADENTLNALAQNNIFLDSSLLPQNSQCSLHSNQINECYKLESVFEVPVTVYHQVKDYIVCKRGHLQKLDFRYGSTPDEILKVIQAAPPNSILVLFMHSFNFLNLPYNFRTKHYGAITVNNRLKADYEYLLRKISEMEGVQFSSFADINLGVSYSGFEIEINTKENMLKPITRKVISKLVKWKSI